VRRDHAKVLAHVNATRKSTFSIVAADLSAGEVGCAVQSKYFSVGSVVPWVRAGVGACATQAAGVAVYGERALLELDRGASPGIDRVCDLRVEDHEAPIAELRRLVGIWTSWEE